VLRLARPPPLAQNADSNPDTGSFRGNPGHALGGPGHASVFRGHEGIHAYFDNLSEAYDDWELVPSEFIDAGAAVIVVERVVWRGKSGAEGTTHNVPVMWLRAGKVFRLETFEDRTQALEAVGLTEQEARAAGSICTEGRAEFDVTVG
jgi:ketosteroid isomerase-like protein